MTPERWAQIEELFYRVADCPQVQREQLLSEACNGDSDLRKELELLLASEHSAGDRMQAAVHGGFDAMTFPLVGKTISHYRILDGVGGGGMGLVYRAEDIKLGRQVALKFLAEESNEDPSALGRFEREARSASALEHPNICPIYEFGEHEGRPFLVMQLLEGRTLRELLAANGPAKPSMEISKVLDFATQIAEGLQAAHRHGIVHRDIKPANIFITEQGQAKILDFGLAKLASGSRLDEDPDPDARDLDDSGQPSHSWLVQATPDPLLSRTGMAMGTAGYMSPEQARGEKLDARTDIFSFGLVLHEMATGQRAFQSETGQAPHDAILRRDHASAWKLNPKIPSKLEAVVRKALEKELTNRYQSVEELRADLLGVKPTLRSQKLFGRWLPVSITGLALIAVGMAWYKGHPGSIPQPLLPQTKFRQLTINSSDNPVTSGAISPNGEYLAYTDSEGIHVQEVETGALHAVALPTEIDSQSVSWEVNSGGWFPDSRRFVANTRPRGEFRIPGPSSTSDIWTFSRAGEKPRKIREHATVYGVSRDGNLVAFGTNHGGFGEREIWLMDSNGEHARRLVATDENHGEEGFYWSPDGQRGITVASDNSGQTILNRDIQGGTPVIMLPAAETKDVFGDFSWLPDGRWIYQIVGSGNPYQAQNACNFWTMKLDSAGKPLARPTPLTHWTGFCYYSANSTADGRKFAFLRQSDDHGTAYIADVDRGGGIVSPRHFTLRQDDEGISAWTRDSKALIISVYSGDREGFYKQSLDSDTLQPVASRITGGPIEQACLSPDGKWILALLRRSDLDSAPTEVRVSAPQPMLRVPITGGNPEVVFRAGRLSPFSCARPPSTLCVIPQQTEDHKQMVVRAFDAIKGLGAELLRVNLDRDIDLLQDKLIAAISPDGTRLAVTRSPEAPIEIHSLIGAPSYIIHANGLKRLRNIGWTPNGRALYVSQGANDRNEVLAIGMEGHTQVIWQEAGWPPEVVPSPDGRHLAIHNFKRDANMWIMENF